MNLNLNQLSQEMTYIWMTQIEIRGIYQGNNKQVVGTSFNLSPEIHFIHVVLRHHKLNIIIFRYTYVQTVDSEGHLESVQLVYVYVFS